MTTSAQAPGHVELDTPGGLVYAVLEDWKWPGADKTSKVLALQPANGSGAVGGQPCTPQRLALDAPEIGRLLKRYPELEPLVQEGLIADPPAAAPPSVAQLSAQVEELTRLLLEQRAAAAPAPSAQA